MSATNKRNTASSVRSIQKGVVFYLFVLVALASMAVLAVGLTRSLASSNNEANKAQRTLVQAKTLLLAHLSQPDLFGAGNRLGQFTVLPDLPIASAGGEDASEPNYDGLGETTGCATRVWVPGAPLVQPSTSAANARCFGRFAWQRMGLNIPSTDSADLAGDIPWVITSPNLAVATACLPNLNPLMFGQTFSGYNCPSTQPYPWLRVVDARGNLLSDRVAFALVMPGPAMTGQARSATAPIGAYLDSLTITSTCQLPCQPGTYNNAGYNHPNTQAWTLVQAPSEGPLVNRESTYQTPLEFNDRIVWVTADELFRHMEDRARRSLSASLEAYRTTHGYYPYAASIGSPSNACVNGVRYGHPPSSDGSCGVGNALNLPAWFLDSGWQNYFIYAVSPRCVASNPACLAPGLTLDTASDINALVFSAGPPIVQPPYATSRGSVQQPLNVSGGLSTSAADWLDSIENTSGLPDVFVTPATNAADENDRVRRFN